MTTEVLGRPWASAAGCHRSRREITTPWSQLQAQRAVGRRWREACHSQKSLPAAGLLSTGLHHGMLQAPTPCWDPKLQSVWEKLSTEGAGGKARGSLAAPGHQFLWSWPNQAPRTAAEAHFILLVQGGGPRFRALYKYSPQHLRQRKKRTVASLITFPKISISIEKQAEVYHDLRVVANILLEVSYFSQAIKKIKFF